MEKYEILINDKINNLVIITIVGYFNQNTGLEISNMLIPYFEKNIEYFIFDFSKCTTINSPGLGELFQLTLKVVDEFKATMYVTGLDRLKQSVFNMVGILSLAQEVKNIEEIIAKLK